MLQNIWNALRSLKKVLKLYLMKLFVLFYNLNQPKKQRVVVLYYKDPLIDIPLSICLCVLYSNKLYFFEELVSLSFEQFSSIALQTQVTQKKITKVADSLTRLN